MSLRFAVPVFVLLAGIAIAADSASQGKHSFPRVRVGGIMVTAGYTHWSGPYPYYPYAFYGPFGYGPWGWPYYGYVYDPFLYNPYLHPGFLTGFPYGPTLGEVKLKSEDKNAWVYLDGALAGRADKLKSMWLEPGAYHLEVRSGDKTFGQKVYVLSGKTLKLTADLNRGEVRP